MLYSLQGLKDRYSQDFVQKLDYIKQGVFGYVPSYRFDLSKGWDHKSLLDLLIFDMETFVPYGFHEIENVSDVISSLPSDESQFYGELLNKMETALTNQDGDLFCELAEQWPGLYE